MTPRTGVVRAATAPTPQDTWASLAPRLAARGRMRVSRDGGRNYPLSRERYVTDELPNQPAAVLLFDNAGCAPVICLDLDSKLGNIERDLAAIGRLLRRAGARWFSDTSPNGGRHVYIPLARPAPLDEARAFVTGLKALTPTLDPQPMASIASGCLRPPGARHRTGGHQLLDCSISAAVDVLEHPCDASTWRRLLDQVGAPAESSAGRSQGSRLGQAEPFGPEPVPTGPAPVLEALHGYRAPDPDFTAIARTGDYPDSRYKSPSHARQSVLWACAAAGWELADVVRRIEDGTWRGLASFYAKYPVRQRRASLASDWRKVVAFEQRRRQRKSEGQGAQTVRLRTTSPHQSQRGDLAGVTGPASANLPTESQSRTVNQEVRVWLAAVDFLSPTLDVTSKAVLYALAEAATLTGRLEVEHGNRSLAIATGLDQSTVGRVLKQLASAPTDRALIDLVRPAERTRAHTYALVIPALLRPAAERKPWRRGRIFAVRPVFRELGMVAAFVYGVLEIAREPLGGREIARRAGVGHQAAYAALATLAAWGLADRAKAGWVVGSASTERLAEQLGIDEQVAGQVARYRAERLAWWRYLGVVIDTGPADPLPHRPGEPPAARPPPSSQRQDGELGDDVIVLLARRLGAVVIETGEVRPIGYRNR